MQVAGGRLVCHGGHRPTRHPPKAGPGITSLRARPGAWPLRRVAPDRRPCPRRSGYMCMYAMHGNALRAFPERLRRVTTTVALWPRHSGWPGCPGPGPGRPVTRAGGLQLAHGMGHMVCARSAPHIRCPPFCVGDPWHCGTAPHGTGLGVCGTSAHVRGTHGAHAKPPLMRGTVVVTPSGTVCLCLCADALSF